MGTEMLFPPHICIPSYFNSTLINRKGLRYFNLIIRRRKKYVKVLGSSS